MLSRRKLISGAIILVLSVALTVQPGIDAATARGWQPHWPKIHLSFHGSTPFSAVASAAKDVPRAIEGAARYMGTAFAAALNGVERLFSPTETSASTQPDQEIATARTQTSDSYQRADNTRYAVISADPVNYKDAEGKWQPIDSSLVADSSGWHNTANEFSVHFSADSTSLSLVSISWSGTTLSFGLSDAQTVTPVVTASTITYPGILANTDLSFSITPTGLTKTLRLNARPASAPTYKVHVSFTGLSPQASQRAISFVTSAGSGWNMLPVWMYDSAGVAGPDNAASSSVGLAWGQDTGGSYLLTVTPSASWLADSTRVYPVTIDPTLTINPGTSSSSYPDTFVESSAGYKDTAQYANADLKTGYYYNSSTDNALARSLLKFSMGGLPSNAHVLSADFYINEYWAGSCTAVPVNIDKVTSSWTYGVTWNTGQPSVNTSSPLSSLTTAVGSSCSPSEGRLHFTGLGPTVSGWLTTPSSNYGIAIRASETDNRSWKRFRSVDYTTSSASDAPALVVNYNTIPTAAVSSPTGSAWTNSPTLRWTYSDDDTQKNFQVQVSTSSAFSSIVQDSGSVASSATSWNVTAALTTGTTYYWRVRAYDGTDWSAYTSAAAFRWDSVGPTGSLSAPVNETTVTGTITLTAAPTDANSGVKQVSFYSTQLGTKKLIATVTSGWATTLDTTTLSEGRAVLNAEVTDVAGNVNTAAGGAAVIVNNSTAAPENWQSVASADGLALADHDGVVSLSTGQLFASIHDDSVPGRGFDANFARAYNSASASKGLMGRGWRTSAEEVVIPSFDGSVTQIDPTGHKRRFAPVASPGLDATFYNNTALTGAPVLSRIDPQVNFNWAGASPGTGVNATNWSARWRALVSIPTAGAWTFYCSSDDGCRVWVDGVIIVDDWKTQAQTEVSGSLTLGAGLHEIITEYYQASSVSAAILSWAGPGVAKQVVPASSVFRVANFISPIGIYDILTRNADGTYSVVDRNGLVRHFTASGYRDVNTDSNGNTYTIAYDASNRPQYICVSTGTCSSSTAKLTIAYDAQGRLLSVSDPLPRSWTFGYDASSRLSSVTDPLGNATTYAYDASGRLSSITDALSEQAKVTYDANGRVASVQSARSVAGGGPSQTFTYGSGSATVISPNANASSPVGAGTNYQLGTSGQMLSVTDPLGNIQSTTYDPNFNVLTATDALHKTTTMTFDGSGNMLTNKDPLNDTTAYTYDSMNDVLTKTDERGKVTTYTYDGSRNMLSETDPLGHKTTYTYDAYGRTLTEVDPRGNLSGADASTYTTTYAYDPVTSLVSSIMVGPIASPTQVTTYTYDAVGNQTSQGNSLTPPDTATYDKAGDTLSASDGAGDKETLSYDKVGRQTGDVNPQGNVSGNNPAAYTTSTTYFADGLPSATTDALSHSSTNAYDWDGNLTSSTDPRGNAATSTFDLDDRLVSSQDATTMATTQYTYDADGRTIRVVDPKGTTTSAYDDSGRLASTSGPRLAADGVTPLKTSYTYDPAGNLLTSTSPAGNLTGAPPGSFTTTNTYDDAGRLTSVRDPAGNLTSYGYDAADNRTSVTGPAGTTTTYLFDAANRVTQTNTPGSQSIQAAGNVDAAGTATWTGNFVTAQVGTITAGVSWSNSSAALRLELLNGSGSVIVTAGVVSGGPESLTYANAPAANYSLRVTATTGASAFTLNYSIPITEIRTTTYDVAGRATTSTDALGTTQTTYDNASRPATLTLPGGSTQSFSYQADGLTGTQSDATGSQSYTYDTARELKTSTDQGTLTTTYGYDNTGNENSVVRSSGPGSSSATWDPDSRLSTKTAAGTASFGYGDNVNRTTVTQAAGDVDSRAYDQGGLVTEAKLAPSAVASPSVDLLYTYDAESNLSKTQNTVGGTTTVGTYVYDSLDRLTSETDLVSGQNKTFTYSYDSEGDRLQSVSAGGTTTFTYNAADQLVRRIPPTGASTSYFYDQVGNLIRAVGPGGTTSYGWDSQELLSQVTPPSGPAVSFTYDSNGIRRSKTVGGNTTTYNYESGKLISEVSAAGTTSYTYDDGGAPLTITLPSGSTYTYRYDGRGSTLQLTDNNHQAAASYTYDAWGNVLSQTGDAALLIANPYTYRGQFGVRIDSETGLYMMQARYYDPTIGRFVSRDPAGADDAIGAYIYAQDNPVTQLDPSGAVVLIDGGGSSGSSSSVSYCWVVTPWQLVVYFGVPKRWYLVPCSALAHSKSKSSSGSKSGPPARHPAVLTYPVPSAITSWINPVGFYKQCPYPTSSDGIHGCSGQHLYARGYHGGIDIHAPRGKRVNATCNGVAYRATLFGSGSGWGPSYGNHVLIRCSTGTWGTLYAHLDAYGIPNKPVSVKAGQEIGVVGGSGANGRFTFAPHLHFELHRVWNQWGGTSPIDPYPALHALQRRHSMGYSW